MEKAWKEIEHLHKTGAVLKRKRVKLSSMKPDKILHHAGEELLELATECDEKKAKIEMGDLLSCLFHHCIARGWKSEEISKAMIAKLKKRIKEK